MSYYCWLVSLNIYLYIFKKVKNFIPSSFCRNTQQTVASLTTVQNPKGNKVKRRLWGVPRCTTNSFHEVPTVSELHCALCWRNHVTAVHSDGGPQCPQTCPGRDRAKSLSHFHRLQSPDHLLKGGHCCCSRCLSHEIVCGTGSAGSAQTGTSQKWSEQERSVPRWRAACWASKLTDKIKVASTGKGTAALGFNSALRRTLVPAKWNSRSIFRPISLQSGGNSIFSMR